MSYVLSDSWEMTKRQLRQIPRIPELFFFSLIQPVMFVLLFRYVFGGAIKMPPGVDAVQYIMVGIFAQSMTFATAGISTGLADDMQKGLIDRFRSLPMARSAVLIGRMGSDLVRNMFVAVVMVLVGLLVGFRFSGGFWGAVGGFGMFAMTILAFASIGAWIGLSVRNAEAANIAGMVWLFPLTFTSNAFVPLQTMPGWLRAWAEVNPITKIVDATRGLFIGPPVFKVAPAVWEALAWCVGLIAVFGFLAVRQYQRASSR
ncbi:ABC transporter permease [Actinomadura rupiterrae]|uniref:ABC transporter permease n=1 Tax=Actinomadura rupiterrae TaxID=559627 RepID=UPI0020A5C824|nr:ABC transporter permease [Actinomadura rupiterrae]MCP2336770.1 ABC-2 type transport system permease protein/oleandomycin transport system permease protein [Actinomadura rupiterrae]